MIGVSERTPDGVENITVYKAGAEWLMVYSEGLAVHQLTSNEPLVFLGQDGRRFLGL